jgi:hypothetical protein
MDAQFLAAAYVTVVNDRTPALPLTLTLSP